MNRLNAELLRLYGPLSGTQPAPQAVAHPPVRAFALASRQPATSWTSLSPLWHAVQSEWALPAPGIAVDGHGGFLLCFSLAAAVPADEAQAFLEALISRHGTAEGPALQRLMAWDPAPREVQPGQWSAFVARDLAPVFDDTPWLDVAPSAEGQADLLSRLRSMPVADFRAALPCTTPEATSPPAPPAVPPLIGETDPRAFLLSVMNDPGVPLPLRVDAAKALLASPRPGHPDGH